MARLMVVDDEKGIREALVQVFEYDGHQVRAAEDGPDALLTAESFHPDVIFLDVKMPGMDGLDVLARLHTECPGALVVMISGHGTIETAIAATRAGAMANSTSSGGSPATVWNQALASGVKTIRLSAADTKTPRTAAKLRIRL